LASFAVGADREQIEKWHRIETDLRAALDALRAHLSDDLASLIEEELDHNELGLTFELLVESMLASEVVALPTGALSALRRAHEEMDEFAAEKWARFTTRFE
jgi:hypothetical protein